MPIIPVLGRLKQEDPEFESSLDYVGVSGQPELYNENLYQNQQQNGVTSSNLSKSNLKPRHSYV
jgi:hypothetical protein